MAGAGRRSYGPARSRRAGRSGAALPPVSYERYAGAAAAPLGPGYRRREPERTVLYAVVREHLAGFLEAARWRDGDGQPRFIEHEFCRYLGCGVLARGFARLRCPACGYERLVGFSCKGRLCPSCTGRRMAEIAADLVDHRLPAAPYRQWVLTFPWVLRFRLAVDRPLFSALIRGYLQTLLAQQRQRGRAMGVAGGATRALMEETVAALREALSAAVRTPRLGLGEEPSAPASPLCARVGEGDRVGLERLCRYGLRSPFSQERLSREDDGRVVYTLRRPWPGRGWVTQLVLEPHELLRRLAALVPTPYAHLVRYHQALKEALRRK